MKRLCQTLLNSLAHMANENSVDSTADSTNGKTTSLRTVADRLGGHVGAAAITIMGLRKWRRRGASFGAGLMAALALAPFFALPLLFIGFSIFILLLDGASKEAKPIRSAAFIGWWFGFGYFLLGIYWMAFSFFVQADEFAWMAPFAMTGMPSFLALFSAGAAAVAMVFWRADWWRGLVFAIAWLLFEYLRGHILTGLPWNLVGQSFAGTAMGAQSAAWWGGYGLSFIVVAAAVSPALTLTSKEKPWMGAVTGIGVAAVLFIVGGIRLALMPSEYHDDAFLRIVQPNIPQREKIDQTKWAVNFERHLSLSRGLVSSQGTTPGRTFVIWPENGVPLLDEVPDALALVEAALPENAVLIAGSVRRQETEGRPLDYRYHNSIAVIAQTSIGRQAVAFYDKHHLVPFGEYLPLKDFLRSIGLAQLAPFEDGFTPGPGPRTMNAGGPSFAPLICYEAIFPGALYPEGERPEWLLTVTNDAWFGDTSGPRQHLVQARLRSIETGLPMARAANTGVSALIDARGVYVSRLALYEAGVIDAALPKSLQPTLYARFGDFTLLFLVLPGVVGGRLWRKCV